MKTIATLFASIIVIAGATQSVAAAETTSAQEQQVSKRTTAEALKTNRTPPSCSRFFCR